MNVILDFDKIDNVGQYKCTYFWYTLHQNLYLKKGHGMH
jgi:hypothetical protein